MIWFKKRASGVLSFNDLAACNAGNADRTTPDVAAEVDLHGLKVRSEPAQCFSNDLRTGPAFTLDHPASFIFHARDGTFPANNADFHDTFVLEGAFYN